mmetsp:Transcript_33663/g.73446  ORF Transcript_33663/g.73446 Transcript_33663/m.73446 type:complete len:341 (+) Transcript_33663:111-1133(+)
MLTVYYVRHCRTSLSILVQDVKGVSHLHDNLRRGIGVGGAAFRSLFLDLAFDPFVCDLDTVVERNGRGPPELFLDHGVVAVSATNALRPGNVLDREILASKTHRQDSKVVHADHLVSAEVQRHVAVREHDADRALDAVVDEHKRASLLAIAPDLEFGGGDNSLAAERSRDLFAATLPGAARAVDVVVAGDATQDWEVFGVSQGHLLSVQLLEPVGILRSGGPGHVLPQTHVLRVHLQRLVVHAGRGRVEVALAAALTGSLKHVERDLGVVVEQHSLVGHDEPHSAHIGGQVVHMLAPAGDLQAVLQQAEIHLVELVAELLHGHELVVLPIRTDNITALSL